MGKDKKIYIAYLQDGTPIQFTHAVDYRGAISSTTISANPPGVIEPEKPVLPEGEVISGIELLSGGGKKPVVSDSEEKGLKKRISRK